MEWISVKDRLPEKGEVVLTWHIWPMSPPGYAISFRGIEDKFVDPSDDRRWQSQPIYWAKLEPPTPFK